MEKTPKELMKAYVDSQKFGSTTEIMPAMKEMFCDVIQTVMEVEMDEELGESVASGQKRQAHPITATVIRRRR